MGLTLITPPVAEPVTLAEAKDQLRVLHTNQDAMITALIVAATRHVENVLEISLMERTYRLSLDEFADAIELPRGPVTAVSSVQYVDALGVTQTVAAADYTVDLASRPQWVLRNADFTWPATIDAVNAVSVNYVAGFATLPAEYEDLRHAILIGVQRLYEAGANPDSDGAMKRAFDALLWPHVALRV